MFGSSGIRGVVGEKVTPELGLKFGSAVGRDVNTVVVGRDPRLSGPSLEDAVVAGALSAGADVERLGIAPTPAVARLSSLASEHKQTAGVMITASHNPPEYNGFKPINPDGRGYDEEQRERVLDLIEHGVETVEPSEFGESRNVEDAIKTHVNQILDSVPSSSLEVVVDGGNGAASSVTPRVLSRMGCEVSTLNCQHDGNFPGRLPEPTDETLGDLKRAVRSTDADLGVAHDGDGDRTAVVDERGEFVKPDELMALFARHEGVEKVAAPINTSMVVDEVAEVVHTKVGDVNVTNTMREIGTRFGGEPSNSWIFADETYCPDGPLAAAKVCEMLESGNLTLSELTGELASYTLKRGSLECPDERKSEVMNKVFERVETEYGSYTDIDGVRVDLDEGWFLIRPSGTEPLIRITAESPDEERADELFEEAREILDSSIRAKV